MFTNTNDIVLDEIALEGLDGITLEGLWHRLSERLKIKLPFPQHIKARFWEIAKRLKPVNIYELPEPRLFYVFDRYNYVEPDLGVVIDPEEIPLNIYPYYPVKDNYVQGSCKYFETRVDKTSKFKTLSLSEIEEQYPDKIVLVASQEVRYNSLVANNYQLVLTSIQYCILERVGRSRYAGEVTIGKVSLQDLGESPKSLFYHRKMLMQHKLITKQAYHHKVGSSNNCGCLLHLPRFFVERKPRALLVIEEVVEILKPKVNGLASYEEIRAHFEDNIRFKKIWKLAEFQRIVRTDVKIAYKDLYPDSDKSLWYTKNGDDKICRCFQLIDPNVDINELWTKEEVEEDEEYGLLNNKNNPYDIPLMMYALKLINDAGAKGLTQNELSTLLGQNRLNARSICRNLVRRKCVVFFMDNVGRQRVTRFMAKHFIKNSQIERVFSEHSILSANKPASSVAGVTLKRKSSVDETSPTPEKIARLEAATDSVADTAANNVEDVNPVEASQSSSQQLVQDQSQSIVLDENSKIVITDSNNIVTTIELTTEAPGMKIFNINYLEHGKSWICKNNPDQQCGATVTYRFVRRVNLLIKYLKAEKVIHDLSKLMRKINEEEEVLDGDHTKIDKKTLYRLILKVQQEGHLKMYKVVLTNKDIKKTIIFICEPHIPPDHELILLEIERAKTKMCIAKQPPFDKHETSSQSHTAIQMQNAYMKSIYRMYAGKQYGFRPRFVRLRMMHQFLYYLLYEHNNRNYTTYDKDDVIHKWRSKNMNVDEELYNELPATFYSEQVSWKVFIPPMPVLNDWAVGWGLICDVVSRLPVNIFVKLVCVPYEIPELAEILKHPVKKYFLLKQLPEYVRSCLVFKRRYVRSIHHLVMQLCFIGLLQFGMQNKLKQDKDQCVFYLNRKATVVDTRTSDRGYHQTTVKDYPILKYEFETFESVEKYWYDVWNVSVHTFLGVRLNLAGNERKTFVIEMADTKPSLLKLTEPKSLEEAISCDTGDIPGDGRGACGLDSSLYVHIRRNWNSVNSVNSTKIKKHKASDSYLADVKRKRLNFKDLSSKRSLNRSKAHPAQKSKKPAAEYKPLSQIKLKSKKQKIINLDRYVNAAKKVRRSHYDDIDKEALKLNKKLRVTWSEKEDRILLLCKVAYIFLSPRNKKHIIVFQHIRDCLHRLLPGSRNKTAVACQRRINYMLRNATTQKSVALFLEELNHWSEIRNTYKNIPKERLNVAFVTLVGKLLKKFQSDREFEVQDNCIVIPNTHEEFREKYDFFTPKVDADIDYKTPDTVSDIHFNVLQSTIHSTMCCTADKHNWSFQIFKVYQEYPETFVRSVMTQMRRYQLIAVKHSVTTSSKQLARYPLINCPYQLSQKYKNRLISRPPCNIYSDSYKKFLEIKDNLLSMPLTSDMVATSSSDKFEIIAMNGGSAATTFELYLNFNLTFSVEVPEQVIILDPAIKNRESITKSILPSQNNEKQADDTLSPSIPDLDDYIDSNPQLNMMLHAQSGRLAIHKMRNELAGNYSDVSNTQHLHDFFVVNSCLVFVEPDNELPGINALEMTCSERSRNLISHIQSAAVINFNEVMDLQLLSGAILEAGGNRMDIQFCTDLITSIYDKKEFGASSKFLQETYSSSYPNANFDLIILLNMLADWKIVFRCGVTEVTYVHHLFIKTWVIKSFKMKRADKEKISKNLLVTLSEEKLSSSNQQEDNNYNAQGSDKVDDSKTDGENVDELDKKGRHDRHDKLKPSEEGKTKKSLINSFEEVTVNINPWIRIDGSLNRRVLDRWLGVILSFCMSNPGVSVERVCSKFSLLRPFEVKLLLEYLEYLECIYIEKLIKQKKVSLFEDVTEIKTEPAIGLECFSDLYVETLPMCVTKLGIFIGKKQYKTDFCSDSSF